MPTLCPSPVTGDERAATLPESFRTLVRPCARGCTDLPRLFQHQVPVPPLRQGMNRGPDRAGRGRGCSAPAPGDERQAIFKQEAIRLPAPAPGDERCFSSSLARRFSGAPDRIDSTGTGVTRSVTFLLCRGCRPVSAVNRLARLGEVSRIGSIGSPAARYHRAS